jgi:hypothetical protein
MDVIDQVSPDSRILVVQDRPDMVLGGEYMYRVDRIVLTRWKTKDEQQSGWARQGRRNQKPGRSPVKRPKKWTSV